MTKIERTIRDLNELRDFYIKIKKIKKNKTTGNMKKRETAPDPSASG